MVSMTVDGLRSFQDLFRAVFRAIFALFTTLRDYEHATFRFHDG
jgi:hypothetical protein